MALMRVGGRDTLNISSDSPFPRAQQRQKVPNDTPSSVNSTKSRTGFPHSRRVADFPSPLCNIKRARNAITPKAGNSVLGTSRHMMGGNIEPDCSEHYSFSFSPAFARPSYHPRNFDSPNTSYQSPMKGYRFFKNYVSKNPVENIRPSAILNPNKGVLVIDSNGKILTSNEMSRILFGELLDNASIYNFIPKNSERKVIKKNILKSISGKGNVADVSTCSKNSSFQDASLPVTFEEDLVEDIGKVIFCGHVITIDAHDIGRLDVSIWMQRVATAEGEEPRWVVILEPIKIRHSLIFVNRDGLILNYDKSFLNFFSIDRKDTMKSANIFEYVSSLKLPDKESAYKKLRQKCSGRTVDGVNFPLSVSVKLCDEKDEGDDDGLECIIFSVELKMFCHIGGLVVLDAYASIVDYNRSFMRLLFGYDSKELVNCDITDLLPSFNQASPTNFDDDFFDGCKKDDAEKVPTSNENDSSNLCLDKSPKENSSPLKHPIGSNRNLLLESYFGTDSDDSPISSPNKAHIISDSQSTLSLAIANQKNYPDISASLSDAIKTYGDILVKRSECSNPIAPLTINDITNSIKTLNLSEQINLDESHDISLMRANLDMITSTPAMNKYNCPPQIEEGSYIGVAKHKDGSDINVLYQIRQVIAKGELHFCMWILWEPDACEESIAETSRLKLEHRLTTFEETQFSFTNGSLGKSLVHKPTSTSDSQNSVSQSSKSSQSEMRYSKYGSPSLKSTITSLSNESLNNDSSVSTYDYDSSMIKSPGHKSQYLSKSLCFDSDNESNSTTCTEGTSEDEYSIGEEGNIAEQTKRRSFSDSAITRLKRRNSDDERSICLVPDEVLGGGEFLNHYSILRNMGKGAFGCVKMCFRHTDGLLVSTKFILKSQVYDDSWSKDDSGKRLPLEIIMLMTLDHPNIVKVHEYFENDKYFQLVTEKWGAGMDLFDFIERNPAIDEPLASHIFRQIVCALTFLRSNNILHQDIKDENIIINHQFHVKLIDFGSAAYFYPNTLFSKFTGTIEYCSPEVIKGGSHSGLELEVWSLGITLYTLMFGENPFSSISQVSTQELVLPITYSEDFSAIIHGMLDKDPTTRWTLNAVAEHQWTNLNFDLINYTFEDIVTCKPSEIHPPKYVTEYMDNEDSMSTTSSSFVYEDHQSVNKSLNKDRSSTSPLELSSFRKNVIDYASEISTPSKGSKYENDNLVSLNSSRTSTSQSTTSLRSTITIDSSILNMSPVAKNSKRARMPSESSESTNDISSTTSNSSISDSTNIFTTHRSYSYDSDNGSSVSPASSSRTDSLIREHTISVSSSTSEEDTLNTNFNELLTIDIEKPEHSEGNSLCADEEDNCLTDSILDNDNYHHKSSLPKTFNKNQLKSEFESKVPYELFEESSNSFSSCQESGIHPQKPNDSSIRTSKALKSKNEKIVSDQTKDSFYTSDEFFLSH